MTSNHGPTDLCLKRAQTYLQKGNIKSRNDLYQAVVDAPFIDKMTLADLDLGITVLLLVNREHQTVDRIALSKTKMAAGAVKMSAKPFRSIRIPLDNQQNIINRAILTGEIQSTTDWHDLFVPELTAQQARFNQSGAGIEASVVRRLDTEPTGAMIFSFFQPLSNLNSKHYYFIDQYAQLAEAALKSQVELV